MHRLLTLWRMIKTYKNWVRTVLYRLDIFPQSMVVKTRKGLTLRVRNRKPEDGDLYVLNESCLYGIHDEMLPYLKNAKIGIDLGAHIGTFSVFAGKNSRAKIYAIEPDDDNLVILRENISLNSLTDRVIPVEAIITHETGEKELFIFESRGLNSVFKDHGKSFNRPLVGSKTVHSYSLKDFFEKYKINFCDFMKVDVERAEYDIFFNLPQDIYNKIGVMGIEMGGNNIESLISHIQGKGFRVERPREEFSEYFCVNRRLLTTPLK